MLREKLGNYFFKTIFVHYGNKKTKWYVFKIKHALIKTLYLYTKLYLSMHTHTYTCLYRLCCLNMYIIQYVYNCMCMLLCKCVDVVCVLGHQFILFSITIDVHTNCFICCFYDVNN